MNHNRIDENNQALLWHVFALMWVPGVPPSFVNPFDTIACFFVIYRSHRFICTHATKLKLSPLSSMFVDFYLVAMPSCSRHPLISPEVGKQVFSFAFCILSADILVCITFSAFLCHIRFCIERQVTRLQRLDFNAGLVDAPVITQSCDAELNA